jgi:hypothetical protein
MKTLVYKGLPWGDADTSVKRWYEDVYSMQRLLKEAGYAVDEEDIFNAWSHHSDDSCAIWLYATNDRYVVDKLLSKLEEV